MQTGLDFHALVESLANLEGSPLKLRGSSHCTVPLPSRTEVINIAEMLRSILFPGYFGASEMTNESLRFHLGHNLDTVRRSLRDQILRGLCFCKDDAAQQANLAVEAQRITDDFLSFLPELRAVLCTDIQAAFEGDPAATSPDETIFSYPGIRAITNFRIAHRLHELQVPILPRMLTEHAHSRTGIDIHPGAKIGSHFFIDHGTGVVIGETCIIGKKVRLYQGVTLGAKSFPLDEFGKPIKGIPRHPMIEDEVVIYSGATILGRITIGKGSVIGGNVWLTHSVPAGSKVSQQEPQPREST